MTNMPKRNDNNMIFWKCKVCGYIYRYNQIPETCTVCDSEKRNFERIDQKDFKEIDSDISERKKKYRRIFKKGFTRKYKSYSNN